MKSISSFLLSIVIGTCAMAQQTKVSKINIKGIQREYTVIIPSTNSESISIPLVIILHGYYQLPNTFIKATKMDSLAESEGFIAVYPHGSVVELRVNPLPTCLPPRGLGWAANGFFKPGQGIDDEAFIIGLMDELLSNYSIDEERVYMMGVSNGSFMASNLAAKYENRFAAVSCFKGVDSLRPKFNVPLITFQGEKDPLGNLSPWSEGFMSWDEILGNWVRANGCDSLPGRTDLTDADSTDGSTVTKINYRGVETRNEVVVYFENNGGHLMTFQDSIDRCPDLGGGNRDYDLAEASWDFFKTHKLDLGAQVNPGERLVHSVYPNPCTDQCAIQFARPLKQGSTLLVYDMTGKVVLEKDLQKWETRATILVKGLDCGLYGYILSNGTTVAKGKLNVVKDI